jgi:hypothetical protein
MLFRVPGNDAELSDKWVTVYQFMQCNIPEDLDLQQHFCENLRSCKVVVTQSVKEFLAC